MQVGCAARRAEFHLPQRVDPFDAGKSAEIPVVGADRRGVFARVQRDESIGAEVASHSRILKEVKEPANRPRGNLDHAGYSGLQKGYALRSLFQADGSEIVDAARQISASLGRLSNTRTT